MQNIGRYALIKRLGRGGMSDVWAGKAFGAGGFEKVVAIKLLAPESVDREESERALNDEARLQVHLRHSNIVDIYDYNFEAENPYLVMEYVEGTELREILRFLRRKEKELPRGVAIYLIQEVSKALSHAHDRCHPQTGAPLRIVHRDVSPSNILISIHGDVKLSDFGIAKSTLQSAVTQVGLIKGKFRYMSPEQARGEPLDHRSDIFSLGLVFYESLFGTPLYDDPSDVMILQKARSGTVSLKEGIPTGFKKILTNLLATDPEDRYTDLVSFRKDLQDFVQQEGISADRDLVCEFLKGLNLPSLHQSATVKREAEDWDPTNSSRVLERTGRITTVALPVRRRLKTYGTLGIGLLLVVLGTAVWLHRSGPQSSPPVAIATTSPKSLVTEKPPVKTLRVSFTAEPYASVSVPGLIEDIETPTGVRTLPPDDYAVRFTHGPSGRTAVARLKGSQGGSFLCTANLSVNDPSSIPTAVCRAR